MADTAVSVTFAIAELWLLQRYIRHEFPRQGEWTFPPASLDLNDRIAEAVYVCLRDNRADATLELSRGDCLVIDYCIPNGDKDINGLPIGATVLWKSFAARFQLIGGACPLPDASEPTTQPDKSEIMRRLRGE